MTALGQPGLPEEIGALIAALLSGDSRWVSAQRIEASGGMLYLADLAPPPGHPRHAGRREIAITERVVEIARHVVVMPKPAPP